MRFQILLLFIFLIGLAHNTLIGLSLSWGKPHPIGHRDGWIHPEGTQLNSNDRWFDCDFAARGSSNIRSFYVQPYAHFYCNSKYLNLDPAPGVKKECTCWGPYYPPKKGTWIYNATDRVDIPVDNTADRLCRYRYRDDSDFVDLKILKGEKKKCYVSDFGRDPAPGKTKACYCQQL